jgi:hypothetical protein
VSGRVTVAGTLARAALLADFLKASLEVLSDFGFGARAGALCSKSGFSGQSTPEVALWQSEKRGPPGAVALWRSANLSY